MLRLLKTYDLMIIISHYWGKVLLCYSVQVIVNHTICHPSAGDRRSSQSCVSGSHCYLWSFWVFFPGLEELPHNGALVCTQLSICGEAFEDPWGCLSMQQSPFLHSTLLTSAALFPDSQVRLLRWSPAFSQDIALCLSWKFSQGTILGLTSWCLISQEAMVFITWWSVLKPLLYLFWVRANLVFVTTSWVEADIFL